MRYLVLLLGLLAILPASAEGWVCDGIAAVELKYDESMKSWQPRPAEWETRNSKGRLFIRKYGQDDAPWALFDRELNDEDDEPIAVCRDISLYEAFILTCAGGGDILHAVFDHPDPEIHGSSTFELAIAFLEPESPVVAAAKCKPM